jgi:uncharacterized membrane protein YeaQ/YmgE (transglycosylase-associated protein family)
VDVTGLLFQLIAGAVGGNAGGMMAKARSLGPMLNSVLGAVGGVAGGQLIGGGLDAGMAGDLGSSALIGALLPLAVSFLKKKTG